MSPPRAKISALEFLAPMIVGCALFIVAGSLVLSPWLLRTFVWSGNPIFPLAMKVLSGELHDGEVVTVDASGGKLFFHANLTQAPMVA